MTRLILLIGTLLFALLLAWPLAKAAIKGAQSERELYRQAQVAASICILFLIFSSVADFLGGLVYP